MKITLPAALSLSLLALGCQSTSNRDTSAAESIDAAKPEVVEMDPAKREALFAAVRALEGRWTGAGPEGGGVSEFSVSSAGSAVREVMFPGTEHEMTNMYTLDGNTLAMTHYCAGGNQPHMRATSVENGRLAFAPEGVSDLKPTDEYYMGGMTLVFVDDNHIEQRWQSYKDGESASEMVFSLTRQE